MRILSIDGGGMRGLIPALVLARLEQLAGKPVGQLVDLVAGTSTGGIIAAAVGVGIPMATVKALYKERGNEIFSRSLAHRLESLGGLVDEMYPADGLEAALHDVFGDRRLSECVIPTIITSYDLCVGMPHLFKSDRAKRDPSRDYLLRHVCRATSAAPTFFEPAATPAMDGTVRTLVDGGVCANNPSLVALVEAGKLGAHGEEVTMVSLGTGRAATVRTRHEASRWGLVRAARPVIELLMDGPVDVAHALCRESLGERYHRLQAQLPRPMALDATDESTQALLEGLAMQLCESEDFEHMLADLGIDAR